MVFAAVDHANDGKAHLLLACTGSVATIKLPNILQGLSLYKNLSVRVLLSKSAKEFLQGQSAEQSAWANLKNTPNVDSIFFDEDEWATPWTRNAPILHIELRRWADIMVIAPLSADSLAKMAMGFSDSLILSVARAWDTTGMIDPIRILAVNGANGTSNQSQATEQDKSGLESKKALKRIIVAPAMNTAMWHHPSTSKHLTVLQNEWGVDIGGWVEVLQPVSKGLACGDVGNGAMQPWQDIVDTIAARLFLEPS